ncbi:YdeI/OmpD-associated family protein [Rhizorhabdus dicambivorans]|uniref:YdhG-like domain-containing protein n=1 Tax=Rhizorhabdus dicambivorans TaxID=1850238 RepID=A0A2A4FSA1_9SPHN|nr:YdeI/OmpD-associated family protein [Rhizorhabdus dicambivorans]ATE64765.1 hypothetical protein CMV14_10425 [Rhizorhabdus dicambivorans]PCE41293.1 hypothetical protein COO09_15655 [Rhizorhabdus dicambivorans]
MKSDPRVDRYIERAASFAQPILSHLRALLARTCPEGEESLKWGMPSISYRGSILCNMAAFKAHATFGFWQNKAVTGENMPEAQSAMGQFGRLSSLDDLPDDTKLSAMVVRAMELIDSGEKTPRPLKHPKPPAEIPADLAAALKASPAATATFDGFPPGQRREYVAWIVGAKREETRAKRLATTIAQLEEGKRLNWKYERC